MPDRPRYFVLDDDGEPVAVDDVEVWGAWFESTRDNDARVLARDRDESPGAPDVLVSTVFLALDHSFGADGPPVLWETLVFGGPLDGEMQRYTSRAAALQGHQAMCRRVARTVPRRRLLPLRVCEPGRRRNTQYAAGANREGVGEGVPVRIQPARELHNPPKAQQIRGSSA
jgi:hypothetical protein